MKITIKDRKTVKEYIPAEKAILIRITSLNEFKTIKGEYKEIHLFYFDDISYESEYSITKEECEKLRNILNENKEIEEIVIHCDYGKSRSPGVGIAYKELLNEDTEKLKKEYIDYNKYIVEMILNKEIIVEKENFLNKIIKYIKGERR